MKKRNRNILILLLAMMTVLLTPEKAFAAVPIDTDAVCTLDAVFTPEEQKASDVVFKLYKVASVTTDCRFEVEPAFADQEVTALLEEPTAEAYSIIAETLAGEIAAAGTYVTAGEAVTDRNGTAHFADMETGLYLMMGETYYSGAAYYTPQNVMLCLPERTEEDTWSYDVTSLVKWEKRPEEPEEFTVLKVWSDSASRTHSEDSVTVELYKNSELYDTQVLSKANDWKYTWESLGGGEIWSVREQKVSGYSNTVTRSGNTFTVTNTPGSVDPPGPVPQTGLVWWPAVVLAAAGICFLLIGLRLVRRRSKK